jgi:hypothetical protein
MEDTTKKKLKDLGEHAAHAAEDAVDVVGHGAAGAVKGIADGVESASAQTQERKADD